MNGVGTEVQRIRVIFHPSDFSEASEVAFAHALKIALVTGATLNVLHVADGGSADWSDFPGVRDTLERWHLIPEEESEECGPAARHRRSQGNRAEWQSGKGIVSAF